MITKMTLSRWLRRMMLVVFALFFLPLAGLGENEIEQRKYYYEGYEVAAINNPNPKDRLHLRIKAYGNAKSLGKYYNGTIAVLLPDNQKDAK